MQCPRCGGPVGPNPPCPNCGFAPPGYAAPSAEPAAGGYSGGAAAPAYPQQGGYDPGMGGGQAYPQQGGYDAGMGAAAYPQQGGYDPSAAGGQAYPQQGGGYPQQGGYDAGTGGGQAYPQQGGGYPQQGGYDPSVGGGQGYPQQGGMGMGGMAPSGGFTQGSEQFGASPFGQQGQSLGMMGGMGMGMGMGGGAPASLGKRFLARVIDNVIWIFFALVVLSVFGPGLAAYVVIGLFVAAYEVSALLIRKGQTVGKMALKLRVVSEDGAPFDPQRAGIRAVPFFITYLINGISPVLGGIVGLVMLVDYLSPLWGGERKLAFHDKFAKTMVIQES